MLDLRMTRRLLFASTAALAGLSHANATAHLIRQESAGTSRANPVPLGEEVVLGGLAVTVLEYLRGPEAANQISLANPYNPTLPDDQEFVLALVRLQNVGDVAAPQDNIIPAVHWGVTGSEGVLSTLGAVPPDPALDIVDEQMLLPGGQIEGWLAKRTTVTSTNLELVFIRTTSSEYYYFALDHGAQLPVPTEQNDSLSQVAEDVGMSREEPAAIGAVVGMEPYAAEVLGLARGSEAISLLQTAGFPEIPSSGKEFALVHVRVTNIGESETPLYIHSYQLFSLSGSAGVVQKPVLNVLSFVSHQTPTAPIQDLEVYLYPDGQHEGWILFEIEDGEANLVLELAPQYGNDARYLSVE